MAIEGRYARLTGTRSRMKLRGACRVVVGILGIMIAVLIGTVIGILVSWVVGAIVAVVIALFFPSVPGIQYAAGGDND
jgi:hypothetical protein